jgi:hypothetical protein
MNAMQIPDGKSQSEKVREVLDSKPHLNIEMLNQAFALADLKPDFGLIQFLLERNISYKFKEALFFEAVTNLDFASANYLFNNLESELSYDTIMEELEQLSYDNIADDWYCEEDKLGQVVEYYLDKMLHIRNNQSAEFTDVDRKKIIKMFFFDGNIPAPIPEEERKEREEEYENMNEAELISFNAKRTRTKLDSMFANNIDTNFIMSVIGNNIFGIQIEEFLDRILARNDLRTSDMLLLTETLIYKFQFDAATRIMTDKHLDNGHLDMVKEELMYSLEDDNVADTAIDPRIVFINSKYT